MIKEISEYGDMAIEVYEHTSDFSIEDDEPENLYFVWSHGDLDYIKFQYKLIPEKYIILGLASELNEKDKEYWLPKLEFISWPIPYERTLIVMRDITVDISPNIFNNVSKCN